MLIDKNMCSGCTACVNICPKECIKMVEDEEGFLYPQIDKENCIECGLCEKTCPIGKTEKHFPLNTYALKNRNDDIRNRSTSGAMFTALAEYVLNKGGVVFGCKFNEELVAEHDFVELYEALEEFRGSKYVQSKLNDSFKKVKKFLQQDRYVLFTGTPCQIAGLDFYLGREYEKLIKCDLACHSVPSPKVLKKYFNELELKNNKKIIKFLFRNKEMYGWKKSNIKVIFEDGTIYKERLGDTSFMKGFNKGLYNRPSCSNCSYKDFKGCSDITIADYWGIEEAHKDFDDNVGISLVFVNSKKGQIMLEELKDNLIVLKTEIEKAVIKNPYILTSSPAHKNRKEFFDNVDKEEFSDLVKRLLD